MTNTKKAALGGIALLSDLPDKAIDDLTIAAVGEPSNQVSKF